MYQTKTIKTSKKWPAFLKNSAITANGAISKKFASLGLKNCRGDAGLDQDAILLGKISQLTEEFDWGYLVFDAKSGLANEAAYIANSIQRNKSLVMKSDLKSFHGKVLCKKGNSALPLLKKNIQNFKHKCFGDFGKDIDFTSTKSMKVVFSCRPWDIATMSMRGVKSCQSWNGSEKYCLIGSVVDPCVGVIYLTDGTKTDKGERMLARSVVRYIVRNNKQRTPALFIEDPYHDKKLCIDDVPSINAVAVFHRFLSSKVGKKTPVFSHDNSYRYGQYHIPMTDAVRQISANSRSYIDSDLNYEDDGNGFGDDGDDEFNYN